MAPLLKLTLSFSLLASTALAEHANQKNAGKGHLKMVKRSVERAEKRQDKGPYGFGYDRCGIPRTKKWVKKAGASPVPSSKWKPCPTIASWTGPDGVVHAVKTPKANKNASNGNTNEGVAVAASAPTAAPTAWDDDEDDDGDDLYVNPNSATWTSWDSAGAYPTESYIAAAVNDASSGPRSASSDTTIYTTYTPKATPTSSSWSEKASESTTWASSEEAGSSSALATPKLRAAFGKASGSDEATSEPASSSWVEPSSASSSSAAPSTIPVYKGSGGNKLGLAWDWLNPPNSIGQWGQASKVCTWSAYPPEGGLPSNMEFLPQYWSPIKESDFNAQLANGIIHPGMTILGFNEPDQPTQANMAVADGVRDFKRLLTPLASQGYKITTPATTSDEKGFQWIKSFIEQCAGSCGFSILQTHYYGTDPDAFIAYIQRLRQFGLPIIISEFAAQIFGGTNPSDAEVSNFLSKTQSWLNAQDDVIAYMFFGTVKKSQANGVSDANLMFANEATAEPNALGWQYLNGA